MLQAVEAARWIAVEHLQRRIRHNDPNSFGSAVAEHAIGLVLNTSRPADSYLAHNARMDARKVVSARRRRSLSRDVPFPHGPGEWGYRSEAETLCIQQGHVTECERAILWADLYRHLRKAVTGRNRLAGACLDDWRDGREEAETADALGISLGYVKKLRRMIRDVATADLLPEGTRT